MTKWGGAICEEVALSIHEEMPSGPVAVFNGSLEMRHQMLLLVQRSSSGQGKRGENRRKWRGRGIKTGSEKFIKALGFAKV